MASIFCSLSFFDMGSDVVRGLVLAGAGNAQGISRGLAEMVSSMGSKEIAPTPLAEVQGKLVMVAPGEEDAPLAPVVSWILKQGSSKFVAGSIAGPLGLGSVDLPTKVKAYRNSVDQILRTFAVSTQNAHIDIFIARRNKDGTGLVWRTDNSGVLIKTVSLEADGFVKVVRNAAHLADFEAVKKFFLAKVPQNPKPLIGFGGNAPNVKAG